VAKTKRDRLKGSIATAYLELERSLAQIAEVQTTFADPHPELADGLVVAANLIDQAQEVLALFYRGAWGELPSDWEATRRRK